MKNSRFLFDLLRYSVNESEYYDFNDIRFKKLLNDTPLYNFKFSINLIILENQ